MTHISRRRPRCPIPDACDIDNRCKLPHYPCGTRLECLVPQNDFLDYLPDSDVDGRVLALELMDMTPLDLIAFGVPDSELRMPIAVMGVTFTMSDQERPIRATVRFTFTTNNTGILYYCQGTGHSISGAVTDAIRRLKDNKFYPDQFANARNGSKTPPHTAKKAPKPAPKPDFGDIGQKTLDEELSRE